MDCCISCGAKVSGGGNCSHFGTPQYTSLNEAKSISSPLLHKMSPWDCYTSTLQKYTIFFGRTGRREYVYFTLFWLLILIVISSIAGGIVGSIVDLSQASRAGALMGIFIEICYGLLTFLPWFGLSVRRLHDIGKSGRFILLALLPFGSIILFVICCRQGQVGRNRFGPDPRAE